MPSPPTVNHSSWSRERPVGWVCDRQQFLEAAAYAPALGHAVLLAGDEHHVQPGQILGTRAVIGARDDCLARADRLDDEVDASVAVHAVHGVLHQLLDQVLQRPAALLLGEAFRRDREPLALGDDGRGRRARCLLRAGNAGVHAGLSRGGVERVLLVHGGLHPPVIRPGDDGIGGREWRHRCEWSIIGTPKGWAAGRMRTAVGCCCGIAGFAEHGLGPAVRCQQPGETCQVSRLPGAWLRLAS